MTNKHFDAILDKNAIAREIREYLKTGKANDIDSQVFFSHLIDNLCGIENYIGRGNQPSIDEILTSDRSDI